MGFIFDPEVLHSIAKRAIGLPKAEMFAQIRRELAETYPGFISNDDEWIFSNAGGAMGAMQVLHCSVTEYVIFFGTPIGTEGHTGRFAATDYFMILEGEQWAFSEGALEKEVYRPGDLHVLPRGAAQAYRMPGECWALEYARGWIPLMLPFGLADVFSSTLDFDPLYRTMRAFTKGAVSSLMQGKL